MTGAGLLRALLNRQETNKFQGAWVEPTAFLMEWRLRTSIGVWVLSLDRQDALWIWYTDLWRSTPILADTLRELRYIGDMEVEPACGRPATIILGPLGVAALRVHLNTTTVV